MRILVIAAHPDDEVLGCGGTMARLAREGHDVYSAILGEGATSRFSESTLADSRQVDALATQARRVGEILGVKHVYSGKLPDNKFDTVALLHVVKAIEDLIGQLSPEVIYTHHGGDLNIDHVISYRATLTATRPTDECSVRKLIAYEVASSTEWSFQSFSPRFRPNLFVNIADTLELKMNAMETYEAEIRVFPHPRSRQAIECAARHWGSTVGLRAAEAFELVREIE